MKVISSIDKYYLEQLEINQKLKEKVDEIIKSNKKDMWHYFSRIKPKESYALKIETGRFENPALLEDFFACTIVVENSIEIKNAIEIIKKFFEIIEQRPKTYDFTHKEPDSFQFDDLRLYVHIMPKEELPPESLFNSLSKITFEIQIKTFLQHAWTIATHDLVYKGDEISWAKQRISFQIKAMLEHAELSIHEIDNIKKSDMLAKINKRIKHLNQIKDFLIKNWLREHLPDDLIRLSGNVACLIENLGMSIDEIQAILDKETSLGKGTKTLNLSPYFIIIQSVINQAADKIEKFISSSDTSGKIVIPGEVNIDSIKLDSERVIFINAPPPKTD